MDPYGQARSTLQSAVDKIAPWTQSRSQLPRSGRPIVQSLDPASSPMATRLVAGSSFSPVPTPRANVFSSIGQPSYNPTINPTRSQTVASQSSRPTQFDPSFGTGPFPNNPMLRAITQANTFESFIAKRQAERQAQFDQQQQQTGQTGQSGNAGPVGTTVNGQHFGQFDAGADRDIAAAAAKWGIPANFMKAMVARESSGDWNANAYSVASVRGGARIFGYTGVFYDTARAWGFSNPAAAEGNRAMQLDIMGAGLRRLYDQSPNKSLAQVASMYFSGHWNPTGWTDELGNVDGEYTNTVMNWFNALNASSGASGQVSSGGGWSGSNAVQTMFGGKFSAPDWGAFGASSSNGLYGYGTEYGLNGTQHTGLDVPLAMETPLYAPGNARVICAGTGRGLEGCGAFNDYYGHGAGRIELELPDGVRVIYGHSSTSAVQPGQAVRAGTFLGTSGGMNSPHTHLEVRVPDNRMPSGYRLVDPVQYFGGYIGGGSGSVQTQAPRPTLGSIRTPADVLAYLRSL